MPTEIETQLIEIDGWVFRVRPASDPNRPPRLLVQLHGWTGNETVMWIFTRRFPKDYWILSPRAPFPSSQGGYSWTASESGINTHLDEFQDAVNGLLARIETWSSPVDLNKSQMGLIGFSQGAAFSYALTIMHPQRIHRLGGLAGFLPDGAEDALKDNSLQGLPVYIAHGTKDERVPIERARQAVALLERAGATVTYCESEKGHKLSLDCFEGLERFFT